MVRSIRRGPIPANVTTVVARCREIGLDANVTADLSGTIAAEKRVESLRELPRISIELQAGAEPTSRDLEVIRPLGEGGMGRVLLARQHSLDREVAIKTLHESASEKERAALISEGAITGHLEHPTIIPVHALGVDGDGRPVLVMKRVIGVEWLELMVDPKHELWGDDQRDRLTAHLEILIQVCNAAHFAHSNQIVHRDIKPQNVLIGRFGEVYLGDWGLAVRIDQPWHTQPLCGTPAYMAPEMVVGGHVDARTDVYLLGATLHQILTGKTRNPTGDGSARDALLGALESQPVSYPPSVPEKLATLANRCTAVDPAQRASSALEVKLAIAEYLQHRSSVALSQSALERMDKLRQLVAGDAQGEQDTHIAMEQLAVEAKFALEQALREWPDNEPARRALSELGELLAARHARAAELERMARDLDPEVSRSQRARATLAVALVGAAISIFALATGEDLISPRFLFYSSLAPLGVMGLAAALFRRHALATTVNRRLMLAGLAMVGGISLSRGLGVAAGFTASHMLVNDSLLAAVVALMVSATSLRWVAWLGVAMAGAAAFAALQPDRAMIAFSLSSGLGLMLVAVLNLRSATRRSSSRALHTEQE